MPEISQHELDELRENNRKRQEVIRRKAAEAKEATVRAEKAETEAAKAKEALEKSLAENPLQAENAALKASIREGKHQAEFAKIAKDKGASEAVVESLWKLSGYEAKGDTPDPAAIAALLDTVKTNPGIAPLFASGEGTPSGTNGTPIPKPALAGGQGGKSSGPSNFTIVDENDPRASDAAWQFQHFDKIAAASRERIERGEI